MPFILIGGSFSLRYFPARLIVPPVPMPQMKCVILPSLSSQISGPEIWEDSEGKITHFICGMGTGGTIRRAGKYLKEKEPPIKINGIDPFGFLFYYFLKCGGNVPAENYRVDW